MLLERTAALAPHRVPVECRGSLATARVIVGLQLRRVRESAGITQRELAEWVGRPVAAVAAIERGCQRTTPRYIARVIEGCGQAGLWDCAAPLN